MRRISDHAMGDSEVFGTRLWGALEGRVTELQDASRLPAGVNNDIALGGLCDLSNRCEVWFGPTFDIDAVINSRRGEGMTPS